jgi:hypothetical protein
MMRPTQPRYDEILVKVTCAPDLVQATAAAPGGAYDALVYGLAPSDVRWFSRELPRGRAPEVAGLDFVARERIAVRWTRYGEYLDLFHEQEKSPRLMRERLVETMSEGLQALFDRRPSSQRPQRLWWSIEPSELQELPWELVALDPSRRAAPPWSFVRGTPGEYAPLLPIPSGLRLTVVGDLAAAPTLARALDALPAGISVQRPGGSARRAILDAIGAGCELLHLVADGSVSLGLDGLLDLGETISPSELGSLLYGSRVTVVALTPPDDPRHHHGLPSVYRAYAHLGGVECTASLVAPVGPDAAGRAPAFWRAFYDTLEAKLSVEAAVAAGRRAALTYPAALFLRHRLGAEFSRRATSHGRTIEPVRLSAELRTSRKFLEQLEALDSRYAPQEGASERRSLVERERARHEQLESALEPLFRIEGEEP